MKLFCLFLSAAWWSFVESASVRGRPSLSNTVQAMDQSFQAAGEKDEKAHDKVGCFCQTMLTEKQQTVDNMQQQLGGMSHELDEQQASMSRLDLELKGHQEELESSTGALRTAEALRKNDEEKFAEDEQTHVQSIDQLQGALDALNKHQSTDIALIALKDVAKRKESHSLTHRLQTMHSNSPEVVSGVVQQMLTSFSKDLRSMRDEEADAKERHAGLVDAKSQEINSQRKHLLEKKQRLATTKVSMGLKSQLQTRAGKVLDANVQLLSALKGLCQKSDESFQNRRDALQAVHVALSSLQADIHGTQFLSIATTRPDGVESLCWAAVEIQDDSWRERAKKACEQARSGNKQTAAETVEELDTDIRQAQDELARKRDQCLQEISGAKREAEVASSRENAEADFVGSEQQQAEEQIQDLTSQANNANKAKSDYQQVVQVQQDALKGLHIAAVRGEEALKDAASKSSTAVNSNEALHQVQTLLDASTSSAISEESVQNLNGLLDAVQLAAGKALIPLRLMKANSEESAISIKEESASAAHARQPGCDANKLGAEIETLKSSRSKLGKAAESLAWETLR